MFLKMLDKINIMMYSYAYQMNINSNFGGKYNG